MYLFHVRSNSYKSSRLPLYFSIRMLAMTGVICASTSSLANTVGVPVAPVARGAPHPPPQYFCTCRAFTAASAGRSGPMECATALAPWASRVEVPLWQGTLLALGPVSRASSGGIPVEVGVEKDVLELCPRYFDVFLQVL